ncbi:hypothetical protein ACLOJK_017341 [Asimina triloba]
MAGVMANRKVEDRKSSARRSFSARFVVRCDQLRDGKRLFDMTAENSGAGNLNCFHEASHQSLDGDLPINPFEEPQISVDIDLARKLDGVSLGPASEPGEIDSSDITTRCPITNRDAVDNGEQTKGISLDRTGECRAALIGLDAAAEKALELFQGPGFSMSEVTELSELGSELLPSITRKVQLLADLVHSSQTNAGSDAGLESTKLEPLIGKFAERLSHQPQARSPLSTRRMLELRHSLAARMQKKSRPRTLSTESRQTPLEATVAPTPYQHTTLDKSPQPHVPMLRAEPHPQLPAQRSLHLLHNKVLIFASVRSSLPSSPGSSSIQQTNKHTTPSSS